MWILRDAALDTDQTAEGTDQEQGEVLASRALSSPPGGFQAAAAPSQALLLSLPLLVSFLHS